MPLCGCSARSCGNSYEGDGLPAPQCPALQIQASRVLFGKLLSVRSGKKSGAVRLVLLLLLGVPGWGSDKTPAPRKKADRIVIVKSTCTMTLMGGGQALKTYKVALGGQPVGAKRRVGDHKAPEGQYVIDSKNSKSQFHLALHISYPNASDRERARELGVNPGGEIEIHGLGDKYAWVGGPHRQVDWTDGCIAVTNAEIEEIWRLVPVGTPVEIRP